MMLQVQKLRTPHCRGKRTLRVLCSKEKLTVVVTGAGGKTGGLVLKKLVANTDQFNARAVVRSEQSKKKVSSGIPEEQVFIADVASDSSAALLKAFEGADALVVATSGVPKIRPLSILKVLWAKFVSKEEGVRPEFDWKDNQFPEQVDWVGQKAQFDAAQQAGVKHVVVVSSMGGTDPENFLNKLGDGNILSWKRRAEQYLIASGLTYTIIHPGGLVDDKGGERQFMVDVDDLLLKRKDRRIPREDVAELCIQSLLLEEFKNRSFDAICLPKGEGSVTTDFAALLRDMPKNCDYSINSQMPTAEKVAA